MFIKRTLSALILIAVITLSIIFKPVFCLVVMALIIVGLYEYFTMLEHKGIMIYKYFGIAVGAILPLSIIFRFELTKNWEFLFIVLMMVLLLLMQFRRREQSGVIVDISTTLFGILYVSWFMRFLIKIRNLPQGALLLASILLITKLGDIGAYVFGSLFGKIPLMSRISPKKTVEGAIAGLICSIVGALLSKPLLNFSYLHLAVLGVCFGVLGQLGDLSESLLKRDCGVKDSGAVLPGMGGVLDEIDSVLFTAPVFYYYMTVVLK